MTNDGGLARVKARLAALPRAIIEEVQPALLKSANETADTMRHLAPDDPATGDPDLVTSIEVTGPGEMTPPYSQPGGSLRVPDNAVVITVGNEDVRYPHLQEYGTSKHPAQPFFWPSVRTHRKRTTNRIKRAIRKAVKSHWGSR